MKSLNLSIENSLHKEFKTTVADNSDSMTGVLVDCIRKYIADKKKVVIY